MDKFVDDFNILCLKAYPNSYKFKQDRHSASCYLAFINPEKNYIYRYSNVEVFANYIEFGIDIGSGGRFSMPAYYKLCDIIVEALNDDCHKTLLEKYHKLVSDSEEFYQDESLHIMAFDLMYCCKTYNLYDNMKHKSKKESIDAYTLEKLREKEKLLKEQKISELIEEINCLELKINDYDDISLIGIEVTQRQNGKGIIIAQERNKVTIKFEKGEKVFYLGSQYSGGVHFENDDEIMNTFAEYAKSLELLKRKRKQLNKAMSD